MKQSSMTALVLTGLLVGGAGALTPSERSAHFNQVLSQIGATVIPCPSTSAGDVVICAETTSSVNLVNKSWDLYADWSSKVTNTATHVTPWTKGASGAVTARFITKDTDTYAVSMATVGSKTAIVARWSVDPTTATTPVSTGIQGAPSAMVNAGASATRTGPVVPEASNTGTYDLLGPVKQLTQRTMTVSASGVETLKSTEVVTFNPAGLLVTSVVTDASGKVTSNAVQTYDAKNRITQRDYISGMNKVMFQYEYDAQGNIKTKTEFDGQGNKKEVTRFQIFPNGYLGESFGATGDATKREYVLMNQANREIDTENISKTLSLRTTVVYDGDQIKQKRISVPGLSTLVYDYEQGRQVKLTTVGEGLLKGKFDKITVFSNEKVDSYGNFTRRLGGSEETSFGEKKLVPSEVVYREIEYR